MIEAKPIDFYELNEAINEVHQNTLARLDELAESITPILEAINSMIITMDAVKIKSIGGALSPGHCVELLPGKVAINVFPDEVCDCELYTGQIETTDGLYCEACKKKPSVFTKENLPKEIE